ncbi:MAG: hypothetical protein QM831_40855 [Kofleriaceae bacterium]
MTLPFPYVPMPEDYPGNKIWFTLRFVGEAPDRLVGFGDEWSWGLGHTETVRARDLKIGDRLTQGTVVAQTTIGGAPFWKIQLGVGSQMIPMSMQVQRVAGSTRVLQLEWDASLDDFSEAKFQASLATLHAKSQLVAVMFQDGNCHAGEPLDELDDAELLQKLATKKR